MERSEKAFVPTLLLCLLLGALGVHRFYLRRNLSGILLLFTSIICYIILFLALVVKKFSNLFGLLILIPGIWLIVALFLLRAMTYRVQFSNT